jgi:hypothetical protein
MPGMGCCRVLAGSGVCGLSTGLERDVGGSPYAGRMMPLGTRVVPEETTLEHRIETALGEALDRMVATEAYAFDPDDRGLVTRESGESLALRLSMRDVARIAAAAARGWF